MRPGAACLIAMLLSGVAVVDAAAQATAQISGSVRDQSAAILPGVTHYTMMTEPRFAETALAFVDQE